MASEAAVKFRFGAVTQIPYDLSVPSVLKAMCSRRGYVPGAKVTFIGVPECIDYELVGWPWWDSASQAVNVHVRPVGRPHDIEVVPDPQLNLKVKAV